jgi:hypothetical protein
MVRTSRTLQAQSSVNLSLFTLAMVIALEEGNIDKNANRVKAVHADSRGNKDTMVSRLCTLQREFCSRCNVRLLHPLGFNGISRAKPLASLITALAISCLGASLSAQQTAEQTTPTMPMHVRFEDGAEFRWLNKKGLDSRVLDSMEDLLAWSFTGAGEMTLTRRSH